MVVVPEFIGSTDSTEHFRDSPSIEDNKRVPEEIIQVNENIEVHFIDVGQGDSILIKQGDYSMLFDAGDNQYGNTVVKYLKDNDIKKLDYVFGSHPHADHIGGLDDVIHTFDIGKVIIPKLTHNTKTFEDVVYAVKSKGLKITTPIVGDEYTLGDAKFTILAPNQGTYSNLNNYSIVIRLEFGDNSFVFTGDAESQVETEILNNGYNIQADVLHLGHHGSDTSSSSNFLKAIAPSHAVVSVGIDNKYGHPESSVINRLIEQNIEIYRTDLHGTIIATGNGESIVFTTKETPKLDSPSVETNLVKEPEKSTEVLYIGNENSKLLHQTSCNSLPDPKNRVSFSSIDEAISAGYNPCKRCNP